MKKFNLEEALAGAKVCTKSGDEVTDLHVFNSLPENCKYRLGGVCKSTIHTWSIKGKYSLGTNVDDLRMFPEKITQWVACCCDGKHGPKWLSKLFSTEQEAIDYSTNYLNSCHPAQEPNVIIKEIVWDV